MNYIMPIPIEVYCLDGDTWRQVIHVSSQDGVLLGTEYKSIDEVRKMDWLWPNGVNYVAF